MIQKIYGNKSEFLQELQLPLQCQAMKQEAGATTSGGITYFQYYHVGPAEQVGVFGYGISQWGGTVTSPQTTTLNGALNDDANGTGGTGTTINVAAQLVFLAQEQILYK